LPTARSMKGCSRRRRERYRAQGIKGSRCLMAHRTASRVDPKNASR
jgi:hypothetical protein